MKFVHVVDRTRIHRPDLGWDSTEVTLKIGRHLMVQLTRFTGLYGHTESPGVIAKAWID